MISSVNTAVRRIDGPDIPVTVTTDHPQSCYGQPVIVSRETGEVIDLRDDDAVYYPLPADAQPVRDFPQLTSDDGDFRDVVEFIQRALLRGPRLDPLSSIDDLYVDL